MTDETGLTLAAIALYCTVRYLVGLRLENRFAATAVAYAGLVTVAFTVLGVASGARVAGAMAVAVVIDLLWKRKT